MGKLKKEIAIDFQLNMATKIDTIKTVISENDTGKSYQVIKTFKTWDRIFHFNLYKYYINNFSMDNFEKTKKLLLDFINSKEYRIRT